MGTIGIRKLANYVSAFAHFGGVNKTFHTRAIGRHALVNDGEYVYRVSHFSDLAADYSDYFKADYGDIFVHFPGELWSALLAEKIEIQTDDLTIELYKGWTTYWKSQNLQLRDRESSLQDFHKLSAELQEGRPVLEAAQIDITVFLPVIALTIRNLYANTKSFYADCVRIMTERYPDEIGNGLVFVKVGPENYPDGETYFIYTVEEDF